jgi:hypothetical protein
MTLVNYWPTVITIVCAFQIKTRRKKERDAVAMVIKASMRLVRENLEIKLTRTLEK